jgi:hypothetical protein
VNTQGDIQHKHRTKGIARAASKLITHQDFVDQLVHPIESRRINRRIGSKLHNIYTYEVNKRDLCSYDDKRYILDDGIHTLAYGHHSIPQKQAIPADEASNNDTSGIGTSQSSSGNSILSFSEYSQQYQAASSNTLANRRLQNAETFDYPVGREPGEVAAHARITHIVSTATNSSFSIENHRLHSDLIDALFAFARGQSQTLPTEHFINPYEMQSIVGHIREQLFLNFNSFNIRKKIGTLIILFRNDNTRASVRRELARLSEQEQKARAAKQMRFDPEMRELAELAAADAADRDAEQEIVPDADEENEFFPIPDFEFA